MSSQTLTVLQWYDFNNNYLQSFQRKNQNLATSADWTKAFIKDAYGAVHILAPYFSRNDALGTFSVGNSFPLQSAWAKEHGLGLKFGREWEIQALAQRLEMEQPDVLYLNDVIQFDAVALKKLSFKPRLVVGWRGADIPIGIDWTGYDVMLSGLPRLLAAAEALGAKHGLMFRPGMPPWLARELAVIPQDTDVCFAGSVSPYQHTTRLAMLDQVARAATQQGFSLALHLHCDRTLPTPAMRPYLRPPVWGLDMHKALRRARIVIDDRAYHAMIMPDGTKKLDLGGEDTINMRIFEATGGGSLLLTEHLAGLARYFEPGKEIATFKSLPDLLEQIRHFLDHEDERTQMAEAGRARCLSEHSIKRCAQNFMAIARAAMGPQGEWD